MTTRQSPYTARRQIEREEDNLARQLEEGSIDVKEYNREMRELQRDYAAAAQEAADDAYWRAREEW